MEMNSGIYYMRDIVKIKWGHTSFQIKNKCYHKQTQKRKYLPIILLFIANMSLTLAELLENQQKNFTPLNGQFLNPF